MEPKKIRTRGSIFSDRATKGNGSDYCFWIRLYWRTATDANLLSVWSSLLLHVIV